MVRIKTIISPKIEETVQVLQDFVNDLKNQPPVSEAAIVELIDHPHTEI